ncbi:unnamed protein product [Ilex paraguariensis]|uniref:Uncharacterized protein n=1 Tax=Ilex paraguariensis TaxID=185542 RepID=A0ABC8UFE9_9AQUA
MEIRLYSVSKPDQYSRENFFELIFRKKFKEKVLNEYLPHILEEYQRIKDNDKVMKLYAMNLSNDDLVGIRTIWGSINFDHPSTFGTLAMNEEKKEAIIHGLKRFVRGKDIYKGWEGLDSPCTR